ncbi:MAG: glycosyltransferase [Bacteroidales bacterium]|nr:glycosyltransferase [Bacteroidales bacterium]MCF8337467.1 glycosyltransferase [Bacteroidales bacterium]
MKRVIVAVTNDLVTDQRVHKVCQFLEKTGFDVLLVGRKQRKSLPLEKRSYETSRMKLLFENGPLFYAEYNIRLFLFQLFHRSDLMVSNDLDTLLATWLSSRIKRNPVVYDAHEYYCGTPELVNRPFVQGIWRRIERWIFPKIKDIITVNDSIAALYEKEYDRKLHVVRNIPRRQNFKVSETREELELPANKNILLLQGAGINIDRGVEELVEAMQYVNQNTILVILGSGDVINILKRKVKQSGLNDKVWFIPKVPFQKLKAYTVNADFGLTVDKDTNINYRYSLPNKLFDYIYAEIPIIASRLPEIEKIITGYNIGTFIENHDPPHIAEILDNAVEDTGRRATWKQNLAKAKQELVWENEEKTLQQIYEKYL